MPVVACKSSISLSSGIRYNAPIRGIIQMQSDIKINRLLLEACEELLPKTSEADNKKIKEILNLVRAKLTDE